MRTQSGEKVRKKKVRGTLKIKITIVMINMNNEMPESNIKFIPIQNESVIVHVFFVLFIICLYICVCECLLQNNNHKIKHKNNTTSIQHHMYEVHCGSTVRFGQALPGYLITAHHLYACLM